MQPARLYVMTTSRPGITYRPDPETRAWLEDFAKVNRRTLSQSITVLIRESLIEHRQDQVIITRAAS